MIPRLLPLGLSLTLAPLFATSLAHAQAPGDDAGPPGPYAPPSEPPPDFVPPSPPPEFVPPPPVVACACSGCRAEAPEVRGVGAPREPVMANRWALGVSLGGMGLASDGAGTATDFSIGELALRFRVIRHLELELSIQGGRESTADNRDGDLEVGAAALAARWRFNPEGRWNLFAMGGIGGAAVVRHDATDDERKDATHPLVMAGVGIERRFHHFAFQAEARLIAVGTRTDHDESTARFAPETTSPPTVSTTSDDKTLGGGSLSIGLSYYF